MTVTIATLGFPRIGPKRELKFALEAYWAGKTDADALLDTARDLRAKTWTRQAALGVAHVPSNDFSLYDHVLDTAVMVGAIPAAYGWSGGTVDLATYFAMARGDQGRPAAEACGPGCGHAPGADGVPALEMTKWFDTNYHYLAPELSPGQAFALTSSKPVDEFLEAKALGVHTRPVLLGPVTFLKLAKTKAEGFSPLSLLSALLPVYGQVLRGLAAAGADWVQIDEPCLALDLTDFERAELRRAYGALTHAAPGVRLMLTSYFGGYGENLATAVNLPVEGLHLDLVRAPDELEAALAASRESLVLSLGVIDGRNVWRADLPALLDRLEPVVARRGSDRVVLAPSCSLLHTPIDLDLETALDPEIRQWLAFAVQKVEALAVLAQALNGGRASVAAALEASAQAARARATSPRIHDPKVAERLAAVTPDMTRRRSPYDQRREAQRARLNLPPLPTTTIGSFPQTTEVRQARAAFAKGQISDATYEAFLRQETARAVAWQETVGLDVLVHGEFERNDMVQYFGEQLAGFAFTQSGWVQSYGSRCVRPPILFGDVSRPAPMTVDWWRYAQGLTRRPMKGMLTGPVTILNWSFVRDDLPRETACRQIALAIRDEVVDLEATGAAIIQIDEAALREGLPLRRGDWDAYLDWAVESFRLAASGVADATQIHTHMCYSEFNDIIAAIGAMDADVISIETARSKMELLDAFVGYAYPAQIGPGVYDIHSPRVPAVEEMTTLLAAARQRLAGEQLWVNPDCGLKTRKWPETQAAIVNMVEAARRARAS
ncbi:5-methyltetrahydropteroyltriglutamate--homocysteine S-methyltransferase [Caulobacter vibrioides]|uniref:5-methyltetrahydropteroyltriglutamate--homocysteine methyltransferase n=2 Tax=Caulobacter vibrioides TaxID=155892 RepID=METE_CAUVC|nr:5-methyltetrahydropteroyltriglutamate--homocysteine S-methyltransferase [Caulobacter vibrioides]YP_002515888.1 5-methyltetrahydropteroyltriglutamate-- homocysteine methyltransferase [Caulobacter vibrioides NA1000]Q9AAW1.1 RecName: Full=5-methyltetrahydropteroyltriglutamate--homocysteine methyltransferase; AltName: Full=Cobalamin-independent methionine synthase; AltName: Full=Methionine synthase, vitamin-B12 independent isozyme [Caulobacter vibrioides CB15]AAK22469.1 5-methyltetrahydropteroylt